MDRRRPLRQRAVGVEVRSDPGNGHTGWMSASDHEEQDLRDRLRAMFGVGSSVTDGCTAVEVRDAADEVVLLVRWRSDPRLYGIPIDLRDTQRDFYYTDYPVDSSEEWLESVGLGMMIRMDTGFQFSARRTQVADYIELREPRGWPEDTRFYIDVVSPDDDDSWLRVPEPKLVSIREEPLLPATAAP